MANIYGTTVNFYKEGNVVNLYAKVAFGASGQSVLDTNNSMGICSFNPLTTVFTGNTTSSSATVSSVSNFTNLFNGMTVTGSGSTIQAATTISSITAGAQSLVLNQVAAGTQPANTLFASGGQYIVQFGTNAGIALTPYVKLLDFGWSVDESIGSAAGSSSLLQLAPNFSKVFITGNNTRVRTIPQTSTSGSTDASLVLQIGDLLGGAFIAVNPAPATTMRFHFTFGNLTRGIGTP